MATWTSSKYDGFPRPGPSFNPLKFKSWENYQHYAKLEENTRAAANNCEAAAALKKDGDIVTSTRTTSCLKSESTTTVSSDAGSLEKQDSATTAETAKEMKADTDIPDPKNVKSQAKDSNIRTNEMKELKQEPVTNGKTIGGCKTESTTKSNRWGGIPRSGSSFNPLKFKSKANFEYHSNLKAQKKADSKESSNAEEKQVPPAATEAVEVLKITSPITSNDPNMVKKEPDTDNKKGKNQHGVLPRRSVAKDSIASILEFRNAKSSKTACVKSAVEQPADVAVGKKVLNKNVQLPITQKGDVPDTLRLVSIRRIKSIHETKVESRWFSLAQIDGWVCCVPHRAFKPGELILFLEVDAFIPAADERFGKQLPLITHGGVLGHRVKTRRLGSGEDSVVIQGLVCPLERFPDIHTEIQIVRESMEIIQTSEKQMNDVILALYRKENWAEKLGVRKWEETKPAKAAQQDQLRVGKIPTHLFPKTDISRLEDCPNLFIHGKYKTLEYQESVKMDGTSMTVYFLNKESRLTRQLTAIPETTEAGPHMELANGRFGVCSKKIELHELSKGDVMGYWATALRLDLPAKLARLGRNLALQGELCGPNINKNRERVPGDQPEFYVFAVYHIETRRYIDPRKAVHMAQELGLRHVPVLGYVKLREIAANREDLKKRARQLKGEGLVYKCLQDGRSFKVISNTYLMEHNL